MYSLWTVGSRSLGLVCDSIGSVRPVTQTAQKSLSGADTQPVVESLHISK